MAKVKEDYSDFLVRDFPDELKAAAKHRAIDEDCTLKDLIINAIKMYLDKKPIGTNKS